MLVPLVGLGLILTGLVYTNKSKADQLPSIGGMLITRKYNLPDIEPSEQGGVFKDDYDYYFEASADEYDVPFALLKATSVAESSLKADAIRNEPDGSASYGLMQLLWKNDKKSWMYNRFSSTGLTGDKLAGDIRLIYNPSQNIETAADLIAKNLKSCNGNIRDAINMYNTGVKESVRVAPHDYVKKVLGYYETIIKRKVV